MNLKTDNSWGRTKPVSTDFHSTITVRGTERKNLKTVSLGQVAFMMLHAKQIAHWKAALENGKNLTIYIQKVNLLFLEESEVVFRSLCICRATLQVLFACSLIFFIIFFWGCDSFTCKGLIMCPQTLLKQLWPLLPVIDVSPYYLSGHCRWNRVHRV